MAIFPYYDKMVASGQYSEKELKWLAACQYLMVAMGVFTFVWLFHNAVTILIK